MICNEHKNLHFDNEEYTHMSSKDDDIVGYITRRSLHCQVEHHVQTKFATPILHAIDNLKFNDIFSTYT